MDKIKLCKDCEHKRYGYMCHHRKHEDRKVITNLVTGKRTFEKYEICSCRYERQCDLPSFCGEEAKYFTPRKSLWQRVKGWLG